MPAKRKAEDDVLPSRHKPTNLVRHDLIPQSRDAYKIGIICALPLEADAVHAVLDYRVTSRNAVDKAEGDTNSYSFGKVGKYDVVIVHLAGMGKVEAGTAAQNLSRSFPRIQLCLVVGICGIVPVVSFEGQEQEGFLGDVVISTLVKQYDLGRRYPRFFQTKETLGPPQRELRSLMEKLKTTEAIDELTEVMQIELVKVLSRNSMVHFRKPNGKPDQVYETSYEHNHQPGICELCDDELFCETASKLECAELGCLPEKLVLRSRIKRNQEREEARSRPAGDQQEEVSDWIDDSSMPQIFLGPVASGDQVMKCGTERDQVAKQQKIIAFEMEGAGVWDTLPTVVIKGACDYADSHKDKTWQRYAAMTAATCAKAFIELAQLPQSSTYYIPDQTLKSISTLEEPSDRPSWESVRDWLSDLNFSLAQQDNLAKRHEGTGTWLLETQQFQVWETDPDGLLCCYGIRGSGKSILMALVIDHLQSKAGERGIVLYQYLSVSDARDSKSYVGALLAALLQHDEKVSDEISNVYQHHQRNQSKPSADQLFRLLLDSLSEFDSAYIVIDALDEINPQERADFMDALLQLREQVPCLRLILTAYDKEVLGVDLEAHGAQFLEISATDGDLSRFIQHEITTRVYIRQFTRRNSTLTEKLITTLVSKAKGMFLLAYLHVELLEAAKKKTPSALLRFAENLSPTLNIVYEKLWKQIAAQDAEEFAIARKVFTWVAFKRGKIHVNVLRHAFALTEEEAIDVDEAHLIPSVFLVDPCKGLVRIEHVSQMIDFAHYTARDFFPKFLEEVENLDAHYNISTVCLAQFGQMGLGDAAETSTTANETANFEVDEKRPLLIYALRNFDYHAELSPESRLVDDVLMLLESSSTRAALLDQYLRQTPNYHSLPNIQDFTVVLPGLHLAVVMNLPQSTSSLLDEQINVDDEAGTGTWTPVRLAAVCGHVRMIRLLVQKGADLTLWDGKGLTTVAWALEGQVHVADWELRQKSFTGPNTLHIGRSYVYRDLFPMSLPELDLLPSRISQDSLEALLDLYPSNKLQYDGPDLLDTAVRNRLGCVVIKLVELGIQAKSHHLLWAMSGLSTNITLSDLVFQHHVNVILGLSIFVDARNWQSRPPQLRMPARDASWMCSLIQHHSPYDTGIRGRSVLSIAAEMGLLPVVKSLLRSNAEVNTVDDDGYTPLTWAVSHPRQEKLFVEACVIQDHVKAVLGADILISGTLPDDVDSFDNDLVSPADKVAIVRLLLDHGADPHVKDNVGLSFFDKARLERIPGVLEALRERFPNLVDENSSFDDNADFSEQSWVSFSRSVIQDHSAISSNVSFGSGLVVQDHSHFHWGRIISEDHERIPRTILRRLLSLMHISVDSLIVQDHSKILIGISVTNVGEDVDEHNFSHPFFRGNTPE